MYICVTNFVLIKLYIKSFLHIYLILMWPFYFIIGKA